MRAFDADPVFCPLLDADRGSFLVVNPTGRFSSTRAYVEGTKVLQTFFTTDVGRLSVTDCMPVEHGPATASGEDAQTRHDLARLIEAAGMPIEVEVRYRATFRVAAAPKGCQWTGFHLSPP